MFKSKITRTERRGFFRFPQNRGHMKSLIIALVLITSPVSACEPYKAFLAKSKAAKAVMRYSYKSGLGHVVEVWANEENIVVIRRMGSKSCFLDRGFVTEAAS